MKKVQKKQVYGSVTIQFGTRTTLMDIVESKYDKTSIITATQIPVKCWHQLIGESTIAYAILNRLIYSSHQIELSGE